MFGSRAAVVLFALAAGAAMTTTTVRARAFVSPSFTKRPITAGARVLAGRWRLSQWHFNDVPRAVPQGGAEFEFTESTLEASGFGWRFGDAPFTYLVDDPETTIVMTLTCTRTFGASSPGAPSLDLSIDAVVEVDGSLTLTVYGASDDDEEIFKLERID